MVINQKQLNNWTCDTDYQVQQSDPLNEINLQL